MKSKKKTIMWMSIGIVCIIFILTILGLFGVFKENYENPELTLLTKSMLTIRKNSTTELVFAVENPTNIDFYGKIELHYFSENCLKSENNTKLIYVPAYTKRGCRFVLKTRDNFPGECYYKEHYLFVRLLNDKSKFEETGQQLEKFYDAKEFYVIFIQE